MSGLKDLFEENADGTYKSHLNSGGEALLEEKNREYNEENPQEEEESFDTSGDLGRNDGGMMEPSGGNMPSERFLDRMIRIRGIRKPSPNEKSTMMWNDPEFLEQLIVNNFDREMSRKIYRSYLDISDLSEGDGNAELVRSHAVGLALKTIMQRSRNDFPDVPNERSQWNENRQVHKQINVNRGSGGRAAGFLTRLFGK
jgi:hypothetical protein